MGKSAFGVVLTVGAVVAELTSISGPSISMDTIDVSSHDSADRAREFVAGMIDGGEVSIEGNLTNTNASALLALMAAGTTTEGATIVFPGTPALATVTFDCLVTAVSTDAPYDDKASFSATLKVTGLPTIA